MRAWTGMLQLDLQSFFLRLNLNISLILEQQPMHCIAVCRLANTLKNMQRSGQVTNVTAAGR